MRRGLEWQYSCRCAESLVGDDLVTVRWNSVDTPGSVYRYPGRTRTVLMRTTRLRVEKYDPRAGNRHRGPDAAQSVVKELHP